MTAKDFACYGANVHAVLKVVLPGLRYLICVSQLLALNFLPVKRAWGHSKAKCFKIMKYSHPVMLQTAEKFLNLFISLKRITFGAGLIGGMECHCISISSFK